MSFFGPLTRNGVAIGLGSMAGLSSGPLAGQNWSALFSGAGQYALLANEARLTPAGDFTIEFWVYPTVSGGIQYWYSKGAGIQIYSSSNIWTIALSANNTSTYYISTSFGAATPNAWQHVAIYRVANTYYGAVNGVVTVLGNSASSPNTGTAALLLAAFQGPSLLATGALSNVRYVNGAAVYGAANFTVPAEPLVAIANTQLLTCNSASFVDQSSNKAAISVTGAPVLQQVGPF